MNDLTTYLSNILKIEVVVAPLDKQLLQQLPLDEKNIRKHKNDIFRLATMLTEMDKFTLSADIQDDMNNFYRKISQSLPDNTFFKSIGLSAKPEDVFELLCNAFQTKQ